MKYRRLYISADIEGVAGVVSAQQARTDGFEFQQARGWMTREVLAACEAAFSAGVEEIVLSDSHGSGQNLLIDELPAKVQVVRSWPRPLCMMEGIEHGRFDAAILLGYHTGATDLRGVLAHTMSTAGICGIYLNGEPASETVISAATAAHFQVPVVMVSGDDAYAEHAQSVLGDVEIATVKWASSVTSARCLRPVDACELIHQKTTRALARLSDFELYSLDQALELEVHCAKRQAAELMAFLPMFERRNATAVACELRNMVEVSKVISFIVASGVLR